MQFPSVYLKFWFFLCFDAFWIDGHSKMVNGIQGHLSNVKYFSNRMLTTSRKHPSKKQTRQDSGNPQNEALERTSHYFGAERPPLTLRNTFQGCVGNWKNVSLNCVPNRHVRVDKGRFGSRTYLYLHNKTNSNRRRGSPNNVPCGHIYAWSAG